MISRYVGGSPCISELSSFPNKLRDEIFFPKDIVQNAPEIFNFSVVARNEYRSFV